MAMLTRTTVPIMSLLVAVLLAVTTGTVSAEGPRKPKGKVAQLKSMPYYEKLATGETVELLALGPFTITARCNGYDQASLLTTVTAEDEDEWVFGSPDYEPRTGDGLCIGSHPAGTSTSCELWKAGSGGGESYAFQSLSGYYVGVVGHSIGFDIDYLSHPDAHYYHWYGEDDLASFPSDKYKCVMSGILEYFD